MVAPVIGVPSGVKQNGQRVDFRNKQFDLAIETKGYLLAWTRATMCPCKTDISEQPDPNCTLCKGKGVFYFGGSSQDLSSYIFSTLQQNIITSSNAMVIRGIITNITNKKENLDKISNWVDGSMRLTVRPENKIGYLDRFVGLDCNIPYTETKISDGTNTIIPRYPIIEINLLRSIDTTYVLDTDFEITTSGSISWLNAPPATGIKLTLHYLCYPTWLVIDHPHSVRMTSKLLKTPSPKTPTGDPIDLPTQALVLYEFLV
jgi:hypothetical protein